jgi:hypothetical protein
MKLEFATVGALREALAGLPDDTPFRIEDPDTDWTISHFYVDVDNGVAWVCGISYADMRSCPLTRSEASVARVWPFD